MSEIFAEGVTGLDDAAAMEIDNATVSGDSPLAHALRRRKREVDCPDDLIVSHDSAI